MNLVLKGVVMVELLVVETSGAIQRALQSSPSSRAVTVDAVHAIDAILDKFAQTTYDVVLWDLHTISDNTRDGLELLEVLALDSPRTQVLVVANPDTIEVATDCLKAGAWHYVQAPVNPKELWALIDAAVEKQPALGENKLLADQQFTYKFDNIVGSCDLMRTVYKRIQEAAAADVTVLITGETGTGKDLVAASIHRHSQRQAKPYLAVNTGAMAPELIASELFGNEKGAFTGATMSKPGHFEQAHEGTIFLDEISTMDAKTQVSLLRLLETQAFRRLGGRKTIKVDVRLIAATNEDLGDAVARGAFREDLLYRFDVFRIGLPPLRKRYEDILLIAREFITQFNVTYNKTVEEIEPEAAHDLERYPWPGNVRELKNAIQRAVLIARGQVLTADLLPDRIRGSARPSSDLPLPLSQPNMTLSAVEREHIANTLALTGGNKKRAAEVLGISRRALYNKLERYQLG
jgi:DNA-binding NtrC family response regulator